MKVPRTGSIDIRVSGEDRRLRVRRVVAEIFGTRDACIVREAQPDADLIRLGAELAAAWAVQDEAERADGDEGASFDRAYEACRTIAERIIAMPAATLDGMRVKARVVAWCHSGEPFSCDSFEGATTDLRMVASLLRDLLGAAPRS